MKKLDFFFRFWEEGRAMSLGYLQGLSFVFLLILGLSSILDLVFSQINLSQALNFAIENDFKRSHRTFVKAQRKFDAID